MAERVLEGSATYLKVVAIAVGHAAEAGRIIVKAAADGTVLRRNIFSGLGGHGCVAAARDADCVPIAAGPSPRRRAEVGGRAGRTDIGGVAAWKFMYCV